MKTKLLIVILAFFSQNLLAHPVIYKDGWAISSANMESYSNNYVMYSFTHRFALGVEHWRMGKDELNNDMGLLRLNYLLWRNNGADSQANIYLHSGYGIEDQEFQKKQTRGAGLLGIEADWETRTLYTSAKHFQFQNTYMSQARVGFSPKVAPFEDLQTWFMLQGMVMKDIQDSVMITPMLRFFYHNVLWEMGSSTRGEWMLNLMVHY